MQISSSPGIGASWRSNTVAPAVTLRTAVTDNVLTEGKNHQRIFLTFGAFA